ncbi:APC family permease [Schumannella soli]|uniref:APC family permease n=1 Tax=Schumannella soli TaxID=2590779 RepID=A0A506Y164_9MICO|nr:APC family permease [Schumannella soli]TPW75633.1 APC family permease [Schumannella soli]
MTTAPEQGAATQGKRRLGVPAVTFLIVAASAPLTVIAGGATTTYSVTHVAGVPLGYLVLAVALGVFAIGYAAMSRFITNAGAFYSYIAQGLGRPVGLGSSFVALVSYNAMQVGIYGIFGFQVSSFIAEKTGVHVPWWVSVLVGIVLIGIMGVNRVDFSAKVLGVLVALEFVVVIVFDVVSFAQPTGGAVTASPLSPTELFVPAVGAAFSFGIAAFMGFESAALYSEESKDPKRTIPRATFIALIVIGGFYALSSWALALAIGVPKILDPNGISAEEAGPPLFFGYVAQHLGTIWVDIMGVLFITSVFAALVSFHNAVARYTFALAREGVLPAGLAQTRRSGAPWAGSLTQTVTAVVVIMIFAVAGIGSAYGEAFPVLTLFSWFPNAGAMGLVLLMTLVSAAVVGYFRRDARGVGVLTRVVAPVVAVLLLGAVFVLILANFTVLLGQTEPDATTFLLPALILVPGVGGVIAGLVIRRVNPALYGRIGRGEASESAPVPDATAANLLS